jgi:ADP-ribosyl-[dinitrogen reductase] hydrolase
MSTPPSLLNRFRGCLLGLACGDAVGTTVEFKSRGSFAPVQDMVGGGPFELQAGQWTDDTSMALCLGQSLLDRNGFDAGDQMNRYVNWWQWGYLSSTGECFDIGSTTRRALETFLESGDPYAGSTNPDSAGNGSLMRLAPVPLFFFDAADPATTVHFSAESSRTTHAAVEAVDCCRLFGKVISAALGGAAREELLAGGETLVTSPRVREIARGAFVGKARSEIRGSGYCVESLEAALWCVSTTSSFRDAVLEAVNLGDDADTTAAIAGQLAGALYGVSDIPEAWLERLAMRELIDAMARQLYDRATARRR